jgi:gliding motility-associated protein GldL
MGLKRKTKNIIENFLSGDQGKRFFQIFYSLGAAVIIIGVLAKLMHWPNGLGNTLLYVGFITEAIVFTISAFDKPAKDWQWDAVFPVLDTNDFDDRPSFGSGGGGGNGFGVVGSASGSGNGGSSSGVTGGGGSGGGSGTVIVGGGLRTDSVTGGVPSAVAGSGGSGAIIIGGANFGGGSGYSGYSGGGSSGSSGSGNGGAPTSATEAVGSMTSGQVRQSFGIPNAVEISEEDSNALTASIKKMAAAADQLSKMAEMTNATQQYLDQLVEMSDNMQKFSSVTTSLTDVSDILLNSYKSITDNSDGINQSSRGYVNQMESLNRNIQGLNTIYEIQLKSVSSQIDAIERINSGLMRIKDLYEGSIVDSSVFRSETEKMAQQLQALNGVYNRLLNAMTMNMYGAGGIPNFNVNPNSNV